MSPGMQAGKLYTIELLDQYGRPLGYFTAKLCEPDPESVRLNLIHFDNGVFLHDRCSFHYQRALDPENPLAGPQPLVMPIAADLDDNVPSKGASQRMREGIEELRERGFEPTRLIAHPSIEGPASVLALEFGLPLVLDPERPATSPGNLVVGFEGDAPDLEGMVDPTDFAPDGDDGEGWKKGKP